MRASALRMFAAFRHSEPEFARLKRGWQQPRTLQLPWRPICVAACCAINGTTYIIYVDLIGKGARS